ncbi:hypothetical protein O181_107065 [Austropuccinia psidii MF-1]|uniref:Integrase catalytic domain-containing protein n=1 Tax=Austropuccinia psidii MF-1 TaxID=1389203 RepID=A0A9Q3PN89_9BASI|nr:hypothetical protein [Austropuccinia psidii MF-1]
MKLETFSIKIPNELLLYSLRGKLAGDSKLHQLVETLTLNEELIERPDLILTQLQDYVNLIKSKDSIPTDLPSALVSTVDDSFKVIHFCTNGKHNPKSTTHKKEQCWAENPHAVQLLDGIHLDLIGPIVPASVSSCQYVLTIVDQATLFRIVGLLKKKSEALDQFSLVKIFMENQQDSKIKRVVSDRGGKFLNKFKELSEKHGFVHIFSPPKTPQHNGYVERANRTIIEKTRCLLGSSNLPNHYWAEAMSTATLLSNLILTPSRVNKSPYSLWTNPSPQVRCLAFISTPKNHRSWKLGPAGTEGILLGYENENTSYRILQVSDAKIIITKHATSNENKFPKLVGFFESSPLNLDDFAMMVDEAHLVKHEEDPNCSMTVDEVQVDSLDEFPFSDVVDEAHADEQEFQSLESVTAPATTSCIKVIGPRHPTLVLSDIDNLNILPYPRREDSLLSLAEVTPRPFKGALQSP